MSYYKFYKIVCQDCPDYIYIGSTKSFRSRKYQHKSYCNKNHNTKLYNKIRENGGWDNWEMIIIDEADDLTFTQARIKEEELRLKYNANLNSQKAYITEEEAKERDKKNMKNYRKNNKEYLNQKRREYNEKNKEQVKEKRKEYNEKNKEKQREYREENKEKIKERKKEWYEKSKEKNREYKKEYLKEYYKNNKEKMKEYFKQYYQKKKAEKL